MASVNQIAYYAAKRRHVRQNMGAFQVEKPKKEDLRVRKTREAIHSAFKAMICEMDFEQITIKELTQRAQINRKTFYLHYNGLEDLLAEL